MAQERSFAAWLDEKLKEQRLTQAEAATRLGISYRTFNRWRNGSGEPSYRQLERLKDMFGSPPIC